jgi:hypothetical protein
MLSEVFCLKYLFAISSAFLTDTSNRVFWNGWLFEIKNHRLLSSDIEDHFASYHDKLSRDSVVGIATGYGLDDWGVEVESRKDQEFSRLQSVHTGSGAHPTSYPMGTGGSFPGGKAAGAWSWPLTSS